MMADLEDALDLIPSKPRRSDNRANSSARGYDHQWYKLRNEYIKAHPICVRCKHKATMVDHIQPVATHPQLRLDINNLQSLCDQCHAMKTRRKDYGKSSGIMTDTNADGWPTDPDHPWNK